MERKDYTDLSLDEYIADQNLKDPSLKKSTVESMDLSEMPSLVPIPVSVLKGISPLKRCGLRKQHQRQSIFDRLGWKENFGKRNKRWYTHRRWVANSRKIKAKQKRFAQVPGDLRMRIAIARLIKTRKQYEEQAKALLPILQLIQQIPDILPSLPSKRDKPNLFRTISSSTLNSATSFMPNVNESSYKIPPPVFGASKNLAPAMTPVVPVSAPFGAPSSVSRPASIISLPSSTVTDFIRRTPANRESVVTCASGPGNYEIMPHLSSLRPPAYEPLTRSPPATGNLRNGNEEMPSLGKIPVRNPQFYGSDMQMAASYRGTSSLSGIEVHSAGIPISDRFAYLNQKAYE